jgi:hypothetical protein
VNFKVDAKVSEKILETKFGIYPQVHVVLQPAKPKTEIVNR